MKESENKGDRFASSLRLRQLRGHTLAPAGGEEGRAQFQYVKSLAPAFGEEAYKFGSVKGRFREVRGCASKASEPLVSAYGGTDKRRIEAETRKVFWAVFRFLLASALFALDRLTERGDA